MDAEMVRVLTNLLDKLVPLAPWAGAALVAAVCLRVAGERPSDLITALAGLVWGWRKKDGH